MILLGEPLPVELMNTVNAGRHGPEDVLDDDAEAAAWLAAVAGRVEAESGVAPGPATPELRELRDALRLLASEATGDPRPPATAPELTRRKAIATLNALARTWPEIVWPDDGEPSRAFRADGAGDLAVAVIARQGVELFAGPGRERLRPCLAPNCLLFFVKDHARREWCSAGCGNRARVARHYQRRR
ncbi:CGNR zinc finger domain-containing protein [Actinoplanes sp. CA-142083]|uniref:CGNR zinc finger domain-containing protein n=1 Tax=Actinoplanes sp. CA-142083 TaxID=3239903 RepID=UPI003D8B13DA